MRYSAEPRIKKNVKGYEFLSFARKFGDKYRKKLMDTATKIWIRAAKTTSKRVDLHITRKKQEIIDELRLFWA